MKTNLAFGMVGLMLTPFTSPFTGNYNGYHNMVGDNDLTPIYIGIFSEIKNHKYSLTKT